MIHTTKIYLVTNCYNDSNKVYIGKTKNCREKDHKTTYGENIVYTYIDEVNSLNKTDWELLETYWIEQFRAWGFEVLNKRKKGGSGPSFQTPESRHKLSQSLTGIKHKPHKKHTRPNRNPLKPYPKGANNHLYGTKQSPEHIEKRKNKRPNVGYKIGLKQKDIPKHTSEFKNKQKNNKSNPVLQYDLKGKFIKEWPSSKEAAKILKNKKTGSDIIQCIHGKQKTAYGFIWKFKQ
jgi:hypothetical protein